jgi:hypothetical protein
MAASPPFRLDLTVWALRRRPDNAIDNWDGRTYRRALEVGGATVELATAQAGSSRAPLVDVTLTGLRIDQRTEEQALAALTALLGLERDLSPFYRLADGDPLLRTLAARFRGLKPPRFPTLFECLVNAIACQQLTLTFGIRLLNRLVETHGTTMPNISMHAFPGPTRIESLGPQALTPLGFSRAKARSIVELAAAIPAACSSPEQSRISMTVKQSEPYCSYRGSGAGLPNTLSCEALDGCTSSPATTSAPGITLPAGLIGEEGLTTRASKPQCARGSLSPGSCTSTSCSPTWQRRAP